MTEDLLQTNRALLDAFRRGDREALHAVWQAYYPLVTALARRGFGPYRGLVSPADVDDAVSATFVAAFSPSARTHYDGLTPYGSYLLGIGRNVMRRQMKKGAREPAMGPERVERSLPPDLGSPEGALLEEELCAVVRRFPETLPAAEREVFVRYHREGLSEEALAAVLGRTRYKVRKQLHRAERAFRRYMKEHGLVG